MDGIQVYPKLDIPAYGYIIYLNGEQDDLNNVLWCPTGRDGPWRNTLNQLSQVVWVPNDGSGLAIWHGASMNPSSWDWWNDNFGLIISFTPNLVGFAWHSTKISVGRAPLVSSPSRMIRMKNENWHDEIVSDTVSLHKNLTTIRSSVGPTKSALNMFTSRNWGDFFHAQWDLHFGWLDHVRSAYVCRGDSLSTLVTPCLPKSLRVRSWHPMRSCICPGPRGAVDAGARLWWVGWWRSKQIQTGSLV